MTSVLGNLMRKQEDKPPSTVYYIRYIHAYQPRHCEYALNRIDPPIKLTSTDRPHPSWSRVQLASSATTIIPDIVNLNFRPSTHSLLHTSWMIYELEFIQTPFFITSHSISTRNTISANLPLVK